MSDLAHRLQTVRERIARATAEAGRPADSVRLLAVSKRHPASAIREAYALGQRDFGENYVQELIAKAEELADLRDLSWHLIGHLQRNKARKIAGVARSVQTVDSIDLADELAKRAAALGDERARQLGEAGRWLDVLLEVSIAGETQKTGVDPRSLGALIDAIEATPALRLRGLMCVPPVSERAEDARRHFERLAALREEHGGAPRLPELSMGMTHDLEQAIFAGATCVRVGTAIFGERPRESA